MSLKSLVRGLAAAALCWFALNTAPLNSQTLPPQAPGQLAGWGGESGAPGQLAGWGGESGAPGQLAGWGGEPHTLIYAPGKSITLSLPANLDIHVAASGLRRVRFLAQAPDGRIFATGMYNLADNTRGTIFILDGWNPRTHRFTRITHFLDHLRNPNNLAFWTDPATRQTWLYLPLTDKLVRYKYNAGDQHPSSAPETLIRFPDYGLNYKYGGWHLTRTVAVAGMHGHTRIYIAAGSSCNYCQEREVLRAAVVSMNPDGSGQRLEAQGLRNAVDLRFVPGLDHGALFATNMGDDHLGDELPEDTFFELDANARPSHAAGPPPNYGWPTCYFAHGQPVHDTTPLPEMPPPGDLTTESERPPDAGLASHGVDTQHPGQQNPNLAASNNSADSVYGEQSSNIAGAGANLAAQSRGPDPNASLGAAPRPLSACNSVPAAYTTFAAHSSPLGLAYFGPNNPTLHDSFLVALHGAGHPRIGTGYRVVQFTPADPTPRPFITGFLTTAAGKPLVHGRPCGILRLGPDTFLLTDDYLGLLYYVHPRGKEWSVKTTTVSH
jgi:glucose/arabinose dehydrogenase